MLSFHNMTLQEFGNADMHPSTTITNTLNPKILLKQTSVHIFFCEQTYNFCHKN